MFRCILLALALTTLFARADILVNSDFAQGKAHWGGDAHDLDGDSGSLLSGASPKGVVIHLNKDKWTKIYQTFTVRSANLYYSITLQLAPDYHIADANSREILPIDLSDTPDGRSNSCSYFNDEWRLFARTPGPPYAATYKSFTPDATKSSTQTLTGKLDQLPRDIDAVLYLAIPPGQGSVTLLNFSLSADDPGAAN